MPLMGFKQGLTGADGHFQNIQRQQWRMNSRAGSNLKSAVIVWLDGTRKLVTGWTAET